MDRCYDLTGDLQAEDIVPYGVAVVPGANTEGIGIVETDLLRLSKPVTHRRPSVGEPRGFSG